MRIDCIKPWFVKFWKAWRAQLLGTLKCVDHCNQLTELRHIRNTVVIRLVVRTAVMSKLQETWPNKIHETIEQRRFKWLNSLSNVLVAKVLCPITIHSGLWKLDPVSIFDKTSYRKISQSLEAAKFVFRIVRSLWNLTGTSAAMLPMCLSNFKAMRQSKLPISRLRDFTRSYEKTSYRILKRGPGGHFSNRHQLQSSNF